MEAWDCCRTCLSTENLRPIFAAAEPCNIKFAETIFITIGIKIEPDDNNLPKLICANCETFINDINKFRENAEHAQKKLLERLENNQFLCVKTESLVLKTEKDVSNTFDDIHDDFDDDDIPLRSLKYDSKLEIKKNTIEFETTVKDIVNQPNKIIFESKKKDKQKNTVKRKVRSKKENTEKRNKDKNTKTKEEGKEDVECDYCHKILTSKLSLRNHYKIHTGFDFVCEHCGKKFISRRLLLMHCRAKHGYEKTDKCSYCDYKASNAEQVKIHERLHTGERPFACSECSARFHRKSSYLQHVAIHLPEKNVQCDQCPARFKSVTLMRIHKSRHRLPSFRFKCVLCGNTFARRRNVARHLAGVHGLPPDPTHIQRQKI